MKESRLIAIILIIIGIVLIPLLFILQLCGLEKDLTVNIITNLECGIIVGLVTALCQFYAAKRKIINTIYGLYLELYDAYYVCKNRKILKHYNTIGILKKMNEISPKINEALGDYHGFFKKNDSMYMKMNPQIKMDGYYKARNVVKVIYYWFNEKYFSNTFEKILNDVEEILISIDGEKFENDKRHIIKMYNFMWYK